MPRQSSAGGGGARSTGGGSSARPNSGGSNSLADELCAEVYSGTLSRIAQLLAACTDPRKLQASNADGYTAMTQAARVNRSRAIELLLQHGCDPEVPDSRGRLALATAAGFGSADAVRVLLKHGAQLEAHDGGGCTACMCAAANGHAGCLRLLLQAGAAAEAANAEGLSCMHLAAGWDEPQCLSLLLAARGASGIPARDSVLRTPMHVAAERCKEALANASGCLECIRLLHQAGVALGWRDAQGRTPLDTARACGNVEAAALLEQLSADTAGSLPCWCEGLVCYRPCLSELRLPCMLCQCFMLRDPATPHVMMPSFSHYAGQHNSPQGGAYAAGSSGSSSGTGSGSSSCGGSASASASASSVSGRELCVAVKQGDLLRLEQHLAGGASVDARSAGITPLCLAARLNIPEAARLLLRYGADREAASPDRARALTPVLTAVHYGSDSCLVALLEAGASTETPGSDGVTPLAAAALCGRPSALRALLKHGAQLEARSRGTHSAAMCAAILGDTDCLQVLLQAGADASAVTDGTTCLHMAASEGNAACVALLLKAGVSPLLKDGEQRTAVVLAAGQQGETQSSGRGHLECIRLLHRAGGRRVLHARDSRGQMPLDYAVACGNQDAVALLQELDRGTGEIE